MVGVSRKVEREKRAIVIYPSEGWTPRASRRRRGAGSVTAAETRLRRGGSEAATRPLSNVQGCNSSEVKGPGGVDRPLPERPRDRRRGNNDLGFCSPHFCSQADVGNR